ncbi:MAG: prepilin-type N-terminal cleavage/methylation domain-containing protein [Burkholderiales bacterium]|nr:prepilin-type N-terminal cleavage/methylation domain-containing protein [Burkholderiales bacterium]
MVSRACATRRSRGFTLLELIVVMSIVALLASLAAPRYFDSVERARERVLRHNLNILRDAIDKFHADTGAYPPSLAELASRRYVRRVPEDPVTGSDATWIVVGPPAASGEGGVYDVRSGAPGNAMDGTAYGAW